MSYTIEIIQRFRKSPKQTESFDELLDRVLDEFYALGIEADYLANLRTLEAEWTITVDAKNESDAKQKALSDLRTALSAAGCATPNWSHDINGEASIGPAKLALA